MVSPSELLRLETEIEEEFAASAKADELLHDPVTDGVVDAVQYVASSPRILWILKEPWEDLAEGEGGGGWSVSKDVAGGKLTSNRGALAMMAYITYSVFNGFPGYGEMDYASENPAIGEALKRIAIVNVKKFPGGKSSYEPEIAAHYQKNRAILQRQIEILAPDIVIGGRTLHHFFGDLGIDASTFNQDRTAWFCRHQGRLLIHAYHPANRMSPHTYVDEIVSVIRENWHPNEPGRFPVEQAKA